jgi:hypothetical protein
VFTIFYSVTGIAYKKSGTNNPTLVRQLRELARWKVVVGVPNTEIFEHLQMAIAEATPLYELCADVLTGCGKAHGF